MLSISLLTDWKTEMSRFAQLTVALLFSSILVSRQYYNTLFFCICIFRCSHWSASLLETTYWFRLKKNLEKCGNYCESPLLPISQNFHDPVLLPCISFLTYCNVAWSSTYCSNLNCIYLLQKRIVRLITKAHYLANTAPLFSHLKVLDIFSINSFSVATLIYCNHHNLFVTCS